MNNPFVLAVLIASCAVLTASCLISTSDLEDASDAQEVTCLLQTSHKAGPALASANATAFAQISSEDTAVQKSIAKKPFTPGWFDGFSEDESSYTDEGLHDKRDNPIYDVMYGRDPKLSRPSSLTAEALDYGFFHESPSGGSMAAWQTHPSVPGDIVGNEDERENLWRYTPHGWVQDYEPGSHMDASELLTATRDADWFDNSVHQVDGFGRQRTPGTNVGRRYLPEGWKERSVNTTLTCPDPGCVARATLQLYDASKEDAQLCRVSIMLHPTDYDDDNSQEHVEYWKIQEFIAMRECDPKARGCNASATRPMYPCLNDFDIDKIVNRTSGNVVLEGKISQWVDECAYQGSLLSAVGMGTCLVRDKTTTTTTTATLFSMSELTSQAILNCTTPGCMAETTLTINPALALNGGKCTMVVNVSMTDFDNTTHENISFIDVEGTKMKIVQPTKNPCNEAFAGKNVTAADRVFQSVKAYDVTQLLINHSPDGTLKIKGKISQQVDECAHDENLLYAVVSVTCVPPAKFSATPPPYDSVFVHPNGSNSSV